MPTPTEPTILQLLDLLRYERRKQFYAMIGPDAVLLRALDEVCQ